MFAEHIKKLREVKSSRLTLAQKRAAIQRVFEDHFKYAEDGAAHLNDLIAPLEIIEGRFIDQVLDSGFWGWLYGRTNGQYLQDCQTYGMPHPRQHDALVPEK